MPFRLALPLTGTMGRMGSVTIRTGRVGGRSARWRTAGSGPPLVLVHGLAGSWRWWRPLLPLLAAERTVHAVDLPGFGRLPRARFSRQRPGFSPSSFATRRGAAR